MSGRYTPLFSVFFVALCSMTLLGSPAIAGQATQAIANALQGAASQTAQEMEASIQAVGDAIEAAADAETKAMIMLSRKEREASRNVSLDPNLHKSLMGVTQAAITTDMLAKAMQEGRYKELHLIRPTGPMRECLVDSSSGSLANDPANFDVYMKCFCDPMAQGGQMGTEFGTVCGSRRIAALGNPGPNPYIVDNDVARKNLQLIGLPLKPYLLLFEPTTFPSEPSSAGSPTQPNTNRAAASIEAAYRYFERLVLGKPPKKLDIGDLQTGSGIASYVSNQGYIARQMLSSAPFSRLFAERVGTMINVGMPGANPHAAKSPAAAAARLLKTNWGALTMDQQVYDIVKQLEEQPTMSMAQYLDIVAYKLPMSPGYLARINQLTPSQLVREKLFLMGIQSILKYQINRWMELSVALEAVNR